MRLVCNLASGLNGRRAGVLGQAWQGGVAPAGCELGSPRSRSQAGPNAPQRCLAISVAGVCPECKVDRLGLGFWLTSCRCAKLNKY